MEKSKHRVKRLTNPMFNASHNFENGPFEEELSFNGRRFKVLINSESSLNLSSSRPTGRYLTVRLIQECDITNYRVHLELTSRHVRLPKNITATAILDKDHPFSNHLYQGLQFDGHTVRIKMELCSHMSESHKKKAPVLVNRVKPLPSVANSDERKVTLIGCDGQITVSKSLIEDNSPTLKAMTNFPDGGDSLLIDLRRFDVNALQNFCNSLVIDGEKSSQSSYEKEFPKLQI